MTKFKTESTPKSTSRTKPGNKPSTLRKLWLQILILVTVLVITVNTLILTFLTDRYFADYLKESYELHVSEIIDYATAALSSEEISLRQMAIELESHLNDPIVEIKLYDKNGNLLADVGRENFLDMPMMGSRFSRMPMGRTIDLSTQETRQFEIESDGQILGIVNITIHNIAENSFVAQKFKSALLVNSVASFGITIVIAVLIGIYVSKKMSTSLKETEQLATEIQMGNDVGYVSSDIKEINAIRESLLELNARLRLKQKTRKTLVDQLVHQTRTPLTILQSHLEAIQDGIIEVSDDELKVCQNQINDIKSIITNMSSMIDAGTEQDALKIEGFEVFALMSQIQQGLMAQFRKKKIELTLTSDEKIFMKSDKYKLSQSIYNILMNAYKYTQENGVVRISYWKVDERLILKIQDTGMGIPDAELHKIFDAYYRSASATEIKGEGLGLYIVKENVDRLKGSIEVQSKVGAGTTLILEIPVELDEE